MTRMVVDRENIEAATLDRFERSWGHTGGEAQAAIIDGQRIVSWHKSRKAAQSAFSHHAATFTVR